MLIRVGIGGMRHNVEVVVKLLEELRFLKVIEQPSLRGKVSPWILVWRLWCYAGQVELYYGISYGQWPRYLFMHLRGKCVICHWAGTDVLRVLRRPLARWWFQTVIRHCIDRHLVVSENLAEELATLGVETNVVPLISNLMGEPRPLPEHFTVLAYLPAARGDFYGAPIIYEVAARNSQWHFLVVGREETLQGQALYNLVELGRWVDLREVYPKISVLVRPTYHDGLPRMVLEALSWGRYVIFSRPFPYTVTGQTVDEIETELQNLSRCRLPNFAGSQYVMKTYTEERIVRDLKTVFCDLLVH